MLSVLTQSLSNRSQYVVVDGCRSNLVNVVSGVSQGSVLRQLLFFLYTSELFYLLKNNVNSYDDASTLVAVVPSPLERVSVVESQNRDLNRVNEWCDLLEMRLNASQSKIMIVFFRSCTMHQQLSSLTLGGSVLKESADLDILAVTFLAKMTCEKNLRSVSRTPSERIGIFRSPGEYFMISRYW